MASGNLTPPCGSSVYLSGSVAAVPGGLPIAQRLLQKPGAANCLVGSSGGALLAAFLSLGASEPAERRQFLELCTRLPSLRSQEERQGALRDWVQDITGGAACTMKQWSARFRGFHPIVYDWARSRPVMVPSGSSAHGVAFVLSRCILHETPSESLPVRPEAWMDVEEILPPSLLCRTLRPFPVLHFTAGREVGLPGPQTLTAADVLNVQERMLETPPAQLTWRTSLPAAKSDLASWLHAGGWSSFLKGPRTVSLHLSQGEDASLVVFALAFIVWLGVAVGFAGMHVPEDTPSRGVEAVRSIGVQKTGCCAASTDRVNSQPSGPAV